MNRIIHSSLLAVCFVALSAQLAPAQDTPAPTPAAQAPRQPRGPRPNPTNIKALPKDITGDDLIKVMRQFTGDLGVECAFCHAQNPETKRLDFASDANPVKEKARIMIKMTEDINAKYLTQIADHNAATTVTCGTCHRGTMMPEAFVPKPRTPGNQPPAPTTPPATTN